MAAWSQIYTYGLTAPRDSVVGYAIVGLKNELIYNGFSNGITNDPLFGNYARDNTVAFQKSVGITADGQLGPVTARYLFRKRAHSIETKYSIPQDLLNKQKSLESWNDPAAIGVVDPHDMGLMQIHLPYFPNTSVAEAIDPGYSIPWAGQKLSKDYVNVGRDWDGALAAYNIGLFYATQWVKAGKPASGGPIVGSNGNDLYATATQYVSLVRKMPT